MKLVAERCVEKFRANGGADMMVIFRSADFKAEHMEAMKPEEAAKYEIGKFYEFTVEAQQPR